MAYIGNTPAEAFSAFQKQDFTTSATTSYTLDHPVSNQNEIALFINFVRQEPTAAYTASGTTLTLTSATSSSDDMYCVYLGKAVQTVNPPNSSVGSSQVSADLITGQTALASEPADTDEFLISDAGTLKRIDYSLIKGGGITMADAFRLSADTNSGSNADVTSNWERVDDPSFGGIGTGLTESSGIFSFPSTGIYLITWQAIFYVEAGDIVAELTFKTTNDNSSYNDDGYVYIGNGSGSNAYGTGGSSNIFDVTDTSNDKFKFRTGSMGGSTVLKGYTTSTQTGFSVIRLGDT
jgi:hypothetical protein